MANQLILDQAMSKILQLECEISDYLGKTNNCYVHFEYSEEINDDDDTCLDLLKIITYNRMHQKAFLLKDFKGESREEILKMALNYVNETFKTEHNYTVFWTELSTGKKYLSYFRGIDESEIKGKFYCSVENIQNIKITEIKLSPYS